MITLFTSEENVPRPPIGEPPPRRGIDGDRADAEEGREGASRMAHDLDAYVGDARPRPGDRGFPPAALQASRIKPKAGTHSLDDRLHRQ